MALYSSRSQFFLPEVVACRRDWKTTCPTTPEAPRPKAKADVVAVAEATLEVVADDDEVPPLIEDDSSSTDSTVESRR